MDFFGESPMCHVVGFQIHCKPKNLMKFLGAIFEKIEFYNFFSCELPLILRVGRKQEQGLGIFARGPYMSNLN